MSDDNNNEHEGFTANYMLLNYTPPSKYSKIPKATYRPPLRSDLANLTGRYCLPGAVLQKEDP